MSAARVEPEEIIDSCLSNQVFRAATMGAACACLAASRTAGAMPRTLASMA